MKCVLSISLSLTMLGGAGAAGALNRDSAHLTGLAPDIEPFNVGAAPFQADNATFDIGINDLDVAAMPTVTKLTLVPTETDDGQVRLTLETEEGAAEEEEVDATLAVVDPEALEPEADLPYVEISDEAEESVATAIETEEFQTIAVTWPSDVADPEPMLIRVRDVDSEEWGEWIALTADLTGPEEALPYVNETPRVGSEAIYVGASDAVEIAPVAVPDDADAAEVAEALEDVQLVLVSSEPVNDTPTVTVEDAAWSMAAGVQFSNLAYHPGAAQFTNVAAQPNIISRATWGAQAPHWTNGKACTMSSAPSVRAVVIHHTAGSNNYADQSQAMQQIRNDQAYHISMNWCDLGYNFVVDKWGNIYEGRAGSINSAVIGAHAAGFNTGTAGISMLGNHVSLEPTAAEINSAGQLAGWILSKYGVNPNSTLDYTTTSGSSKYKAGSTVNLPAILAHRDVQATSCPGDRGYAQMGNIRNAAQGNYQPAQQPAAPPPPPPNQDPVGVIESATYNAGQVTVKGWAYDPDSPADKSIVVDVYIDSAFKTSLRADVMRADVNTYAKRPAGSLSGYYGVIKGVAAGNHEVCTYAINTPTGHNPQLGCKTITMNVASTANQSSPAPAKTTAPTAAAPAIKPVPVPVTVKLAPGAANKTPVGVVEFVTLKSNQISVKGWAYDPDMPGSSFIYVDAYVDGKYKNTLRADVLRADVNSYVGRPAGSLSGYTGTIGSVAPGKHEVCLFGINAPQGDNPLLGCKSVGASNTAAPTTTPAPAPAAPKTPEPVKPAPAKQTGPNQNPVGVVDSVTLKSGQVTVKGWAYDPDLPGNSWIYVDVFVDNVYKTSLKANIMRDDVNNYAKRPAGSVSGYLGTVSGIGSGAHEVCVYAINSPKGYNPELGCKWVGGNPPAPKAPAANLPTVNASYIDPADAILGNSQMNAATMASFLLKNNPSPQITVSPQELAQLYLDEGARVGLRGDVAFMQAIKETGWFKFGGAVQPSQNNFAGIGATGSTPGNSFPSAAMGVRAHIQHLFAYASKGNPPDPVVDPRFGLVNRGIAPTWQELNGRWAVPGTNYGQTIIQRYNDLVSYARGI